MAERAYERSRTILAALGDQRPRDAKEYEAFRKSLAADDERLRYLPHDPATVFKFNGAQRSWSGMLGVERNVPPTPDDLKALLMVLYQDGSQSAEDAGPGPALYAKMRRMCSTLPPRVDQDWKAYFDFLDRAIWEGFKKHKVLWPYIPELMDALGIERIRSKSFE